MYILFLLYFQIIFPYINLIQKLCFRHFYFNLLFFFSRKRKTELPCLAITHRISNGSAFAISQCCCCCCSLKLFFSPLLFCSDSCALYIFLPGSMYVISSDLKVLCLIFIAVDLHENRIQHTTASHSDYVFSLN